MKVYMYRWIGLITSFFLLSLLLGFLTLGVASANGSRIILSSFGQRMREEKMTKDVLLLTGVVPYSPREETLTDMKATLSQWEQIQRGLLYGDASLGLPSNPPPAIVIQVKQSNLDYTPLDSVYRQILKHPTVSALQLQIVIAHSYLYSLELAQVNALWKAELDTQYQAYYYLELLMIAIIEAVIVLNVLHLLRMRTREKRQSSEEYADKNLAPLSITEDQIDTEQ